jgi:hypothetical protein
MLPTVGGRLDREIRTCTSASVTVEQRVRRTAMAQWLLLTRVTSLRLLACTYQFDK